MAFNEIMSDEQLLKYENNYLNLDIPFSSSFTTEIVTINSFYFPLYQTLISLNKNNNLYCLTPQGTMALCLGHTAVQQILHIIQLCELCCFLEQNH